MIKSEFALSLKAINDIKPKPDEMLRALQMIEANADNIDFQNENLNYIAPLIHHIFLPSFGQIRSVLLKLICEFEVRSEESIIEEYQFDKLIALSIDQRPSDQNQSKVDSEKSAAFQCVSILLKYRKYLPPSILRAMVSIYNVPNHPYKPLILAYLLEAALNNSKIEDIPDITTIFVDAFHNTGNKGVIALIDYAAEHKLPFVLVDKFASRLIDPISQYLTKKESSLDTPVRAISKLLKSWSSMLRYGFQNNLLTDLISCLPHQTNAVISIFKEVLNLTETPCIADGFTGLILYSLIKFGLIEKLNDLASSTPSAAAFLGELLPYVSQSDSRFIDLSSSSYQAKQINTFQEFPLKIRKHAQQSDTSDSVTSITNFVLPPDFNKWDWTNINKILAVILPHNEAEANSSTTAKFLNQLMDCLSQTFYNDPLDTKQNRTLNMIDALHSLLTLLESNPKLWPIIEKHEGMKKAFEKTIQTLTTNEIVPANSPCATFYEVLAVMMATPQGSSVLKNMELVEKLIPLGIVVKVPQNVRLILTLTKLVPDSVSVEVFRGFLLSGNAAAQQIALEIVKEKRHSTQHFVECVFKSIVLPLLKQQLDQDQMNAALNLVAELCQDDNECKKCVAEDPQVIEVISKKARLLLACLVSCEEILNKIDVDAEVNFWFDTGNKKYTKIFDMAIESFYTMSQNEQKEEEINNNHSTQFIPIQPDMRNSSSASLLFLPKAPSIIFVNGKPQIPPHLFGELAKTKAGLEIVKKHIPQLIELLKSKSAREKRATFFAIASIAASPIADSLVEEQDFGELLFKATKQSDSLIIHGTLINCLSVFHESHYLSKLLSKHNWQFFHYGRRSCVLPVDPVAFVGETPKCEPVSAKMPDIPGEEDKTKLLRGLTSSISFKKTKEIVKIKFKENPNCFNKSSLSLYGNELMANYSVSPDARFFLEVLFKTTSVLPLSNEEVDPKAASEAGAKVFECFNAPATAISIADVKIQEISLETCKKLGRTRYADAFLSEDEFKKVAGVSKEAFYALKADQRQEILQKFA